MDAKPCRKCGERKPLDAFAKSAASRDGRQSQCRECVSEWGKAHRRELARTAVVPVAKKCSRCGEIKPAADFTRERGREDGLGNYCRPCRRAYVRSPAARETQRRQRRSEKRHRWLRKYQSSDRFRLELLPQARRRYAAQRLAAQAVVWACKLGLLVRPSRCSACEQPPRADSGRGIEAHHYAGYERENWLKVQWLCCDCHEALHRSP